MGGLGSEPCTACCFYNHYVKMRTFPVINCHSYYYIPTEQGNASCFFICCKLQSTALRANWLLLTQMGICLRDVACIRTVLNMWSSSQTSILNYFSVHKQKFISILVEKLLLRHSKTHSGAKNHWLNTFLQMSHFPFSYMHILLQICPTEDIYYSN